MKTASALTAESIDLIVKSGRITKTGGRKKTIRLMQEIK
jgi:hypothetical protein